jgi:hypothetical protein
MPRQAREKAPAGTGAQLQRDLETVVAIVNRAQQRLAGAAATELDLQQSKAARHQIDRIQKQLHRIDEEIQPGNKPHVEPSPTHHDAGTECALEWRIQRASLPERWRIVPRASYSNASPAWTYF